MADRLLDHLTGAIGGVAAVYQRSRFLPERRAALEAWARHVVACGEGEDADGENLAPADFAALGGAGDPQAASQALVDLALERGATDNVSAVVLWYRAGVDTAPG